MKLMKIDLIVEIIMAAGMLEKVGNDLTPLSI